MNIKDLLKSKKFKNILITIVEILVVAGIISSMAAYAIARMTWKLKNAVYGLFMIGIMIPAQAALLPLFQILDKLGLKGGYLGLIIPYIAGALPMSIMILVGFYRGIPREMEEAAYIDGCNRWQTYWKIVFPLLKPTIATVAIIDAMAFWNDYLLPSLVLGRKELYTLPIATQAFYGTYSTDLGLVLTALLLAMLPILVLYLFLQRYIVEGVTSGAVKG